jgi:MYXO-CTERM domain-containing protein
VEELESKHELSLDSLVCCDGAYAWTEDCGEIEWWGDGYCAASQVRRRLVGRLPVDHEALGPTLRYNFAVDLGTWPGALPSWKSSAISTEVVPKCITATFIDLARARSLEHEVCFGQDFTEPLGLQPRDAGEDLGANCVGEAYQCVHDGWNWDPDACGPPGGDGADGCGCRTGASGLGTVLFALGLFALVRPRRLSV